MYLRGLELAEPVKAMIENGLVVTLSLGCGFSGSVYRDDEAVDTPLRSGEPDSVTETESLSANQECTSPGSPVRNGRAHRDASSKPS